MANARKKASKKKSQVRNGGTTARKKPARKAATTRQRPAARNASDTRQKPASRKSPAPSKSPAAKSRAPRAIPSDKSWRELIETALATPEPTSQDLSAFMKPAARPKARKRAK